MRSETGWLKTEKSGLSRFAIPIRWAERVLWVVGAAVLAQCVFFLASGLYEQARGERELASAVSAPSPGRRSVPLPEGSVVGRIRMPRLDLSAVIFEGTSKSVLMKGVGRLRGSALPADSGNLVLAAHRDTFFSGLRDAQKGDVVIVETPTGVFRYRVQTTRVVPPSAVEVLKPTRSSTVTLITCYPFGYLGRAPDRFIVQAERAGEDAQLSSN